MTDSYRMTKTLSASRMEHVNLGYSDSKSVFTAWFNLALICGLSFGFVTVTALFYESSNTDANDFKVFLVLLTAFALVFAGIAVRDLVASRKGRGYSVSVDGIAEFAVSRGISSGSARDLAVKIAEGIPEPFSYWFTFYTDSTGRVFKATVVNDSTGRFLELWISPVDGYPPAPVSSP